MRKKRVLYLEYYRIYSLGQVISSKVKKATESEIKYRRFLHKKGKCPHDIVYDKDDGFMWHHRYCGICNKFLGLI